MSWSSSTTIFFFIIGVPNVVLEYKYLNFVLCDNGTQSSPLTVAHKKGLYIFFFTKTPSIGQDFLPFFRAYWIASTQQIDFFINSTCLQEKNHRDTFFHILLAFLLLNTNVKATFSITSKFSEILWQRSKTNKMGC